MKDILKIEILKLKSSKILWIVVLVPIFIVFQGTLNLIRYYDLFTGKGQNVWQQLYTQSMIFYTTILFPVLISIVMTLMARIENANNGWKYFLSLPIEKGRVYGIKFIIGCVLIFINILVLITSMLASGKIIGVGGMIPYKVVFLQPILAYMAALPIMAISYVLSIKFSHMAVPLGTGIGLSMPAILVANSRFWIFYPWTYPIMAALGGEFDAFSKGLTVYFISLILLIAVFFLGYTEFKRRDII